MRHLKGVQHKRLMEIDLPIAEMPVQWRGTLAMGLGARFLPGLFVLRVA